MYNNVGSSIGLASSTSVDAVWDEIRCWPLRAMAGALLLVAFVAWSTMTASRVASSTLDVLVFGLPALSLLVLLLSRWTTKGAAIVLVGGILLVLGVVAWSQPETVVTSTFSVVVLIAGLLLGRRAAIVVAIPALLFVLATNPDRAGLMSVPTGAAVICLSAGLCWLALLPFEVAIEGLWRSYRQSRDAVDELRAKQGVFNSALKQLDDACYRLERANEELASARKAAEEARRMKAEFAATVSHELRTPLNLIVGFSEMMVLNPCRIYGQPLPESYQGDLEAMYRNASHVSHLLDDILDLSQIEAHRMPLRREISALIEVVGEAAATVNSLFRDKNLNLDVQLSNDLPVLWVDPSRLRQVLINLLANAVRFTDEGGVCIKARVDERDITFSVADTGAGMSPEELPRVFDEFYQAGESRRSGRGSGLGLAISKRFVEMHGGNMWVESQKGEGTTFFFSLPLTQNVATAVVPPDYDRLISSGQSPFEEKILAVLDDDPDVARILERYLDGYRVVGPPKGSRQSPKTPRLVPRAIIVSKIVAEDGCVKQPSLPPDWSNQPVIMLPLRSVRHTARELGVVDYLVKPVSRAQLAAVLRRLGRGHRELLVIDDDPEMVRLLTRMIRAISPRYVVRVAYSGTEAVQLLDSTPPDVVLLDLLMPILDGYAVLEAIRASEHWRDVPVVVISAKGVEDESIVISMVGISRSGGLTVGEAVHCVECLLEATQSRAVLPGPENVRPA